MKLQFKYNILQFIVILYIQPCKNRKEDINNVYVGEKQT